MPIKFRFRWVPFMAMLVAVAVGVSLGQWQTRRAQAKESIERQLQQRLSAQPVSVGNTPLASDAIEYRRVKLQGKFVAGWPVYLDNRPLQGRAGLYVLMPLKLAGSDMHVLVMRGWLPRDPRDRAAIAPFPTPSGVLEIDGVARRNPGLVLNLGDAATLRPGAIVQNLDVAQFARDSGLAMQPFVVEQTSDNGDGLVRDWPSPSLGIEKHRGYAFQWYALAATAFLFFVVTGFRRGSR
jgi:cytochrome oxidase assembly protein ShyY1